MTDKISISLYELAYGCHLYGAMTGFDKALSKARRALHPEPDLLKTEHRDATLEFLRAWGCRLAKADTELSSDALLSWTRAHAADLPKPGRSVETLNDGELAAVAQAYANLAAKKAGKRARFGPVAAAKTLFLLHPHSCPPWDNAIRGYLSCDDPGTAGYRRYLGEVGRLVRVLAEEAGVSVAELPLVVERPESSAAEVVDEYLWVRCSQNWKPPSPEMLGRWVAWARRNHPD